MISKLIYKRISRCGGDKTKNDKQMPQRLFVVAVCIGLCVGCQDRYQEGYQDGYSTAMSQVSNCTTQLDRCEQEKKNNSYSSSSSNFSSVTTEVCGGNGLTLNGKHVRPGKTGCVRAYSDGRVERY